MSHAETCPICKGKGKVKNPSPFSTGSEYGTCHGCNGKGWVIVQ